MIIRILPLTLMSFVLVAGATQAQTPQDKATLKGGRDSAPRSISAIQADIHAALRAEASTRRNGDNTPEVLRLVDLYYEMAAHPKHADSGTLQQLGQQLRTRLATVRDHIERHGGSDRSSTKPRNLDAIARQQTRVLAQQIPQPANAANQPAAGVGNNRPPSTRRADYGPDLVALIQQTISPETWNINGGNGAIVYYAPFHAIVVSASGDVHTQIGGVLGQLRAAP